MEIAVRSDTISSGKEKVWVGSEASARPELLRCSDLLGLGSALVVRQTHDAESHDYGYDGKASVSVVVVMQGRHTVGYATDVHDCPNHRPNEYSESTYLFLFRAIESLIR